jgi:dTDP-glucose 4,6-dehydratase
MAFERNILLTGGAGFIGSHLVRYLISRYPNYRIVNYDKLTYAGNLENLKGLEEAPNYVFVHADVCDAATVDDVFSTYGIDAVIHLAAESHVDRSIANPLAFIDTNIRGTAVLLNAAVAHWRVAGHYADHHRFHHVSTDEVFGALGDTGLFNEETAYDPRSPYSASKASSDHLVRSYGHTYGLPFTLSNCSNNYGTHQYPEKLIPVIIKNIVAGDPLPVYGRGENIRDWLSVTDHVEAIDAIFHQGVLGETYCVGGDNEWKNIDLVRLLCKLADVELGHPTGRSQSLISFVTDRPGHDHRYAIDASKIKNELGWKPRTPFHEGLLETVRFFIAQFSPKR